MPPLSSTPPSSPSYRDSSIDNDHRLSMNPNLRQISPNRSKRKAAGTAIAPANKRLQHVTDLGNDEAEDMAAAILGRSTFRPVSIRSNSFRSSRPIRTTPKENLDPAVVTQEGTKSIGSWGIYDETPEPSHGLQRSPDGGSHDTNLGHSALENQEALYPPLTWQKINLFDGMRLPVVVAMLPPVRHLGLPDDPFENFSLEFLKSSLGGTHYANGWYVKTSKEGRQQHDEAFPEIRSYMIVEGDHEPLLPKSPCHHGATIAPFLYHLEPELALEENLKHIPLFIRRSNGGYRYYGTYREHRYSDRLSANDMIELPHHVKLHWAKKMGSNRKPRWAIETIKAAWPKTAVGWLGDDQKSIIEYDPELKDSLGEPMEIPISDLEAESVTADEIMQAFENPDMGGEPAMRLFYEYLQCDGYDKAFYEALVAKKHEL